MKKSTHHLEQVLNLNERLFLNSLEGIDDELAGERISDHNNPMIWIATHATWARFNMLLFLDKPIKNPYAGKFENARVYDAADGYPLLKDLKAEWKRSSQLLKEALQTVPEEVLEAEASFKSPVKDGSNGGTFAFLVQHESFTIGQMAFLKKYLTLEAMKYQ